MHIGISPFASTRAGMARAADAAVAAGADSLWLGDGLLTVDEFPRWGGGIEAFTHLGWLAGRHQDTGLGLGAAVVGFRDVRWLARQAATLDQLTEGRFVLVLAPGRWEREFEYLGVDYGSRGRAFREAIAALGAAFAGEPFDGEFTRLPAGARLSPEPYTAAGPPIWLGGGPATFDHAIATGLPFLARRSTPAQLAPVAAEWFDRGGTTLAVRVPFQLRRPGDPEETSPPFGVAGTAEYLAEQLHAYAELGVATVSIIPGQDDARSLATIEALATHVLPSLRASR